MNQFSPSTRINFNKFTTSTMALLNYWCLLLLILRVSFVVSQDSAASSSSSSSSSGVSSSLVQQNSVSTPKPENPYEIRTWEAFSSALKMPVSLEGDAGACKTEIYDKTLECYKASAIKWNNGGEAKSFCCFTHEVLDCFIEMVPTYCDATGLKIYLNPDKQKAIYFSESKDECGDYDTFWHCANGIPIVVGSTCGALVVIILVVGGTIYYLRKRKGGSSLRPSENL